MAKKAVTKKYKTTLARTGQEFGPEDFEPAGGLEEMKGIETNPEVIEGLERAATPQATGEVSVGKGRVSPSFQSLQELGATPDVPAGGNAGIEGFEPGVSARRDTASRDNYKGLGEVGVEDLSDDVIQRPAPPGQAFRDIQVPVGTLREQGIVGDPYMAIKPEERQTVQREMSDEALIAAMKADSAFRNLSADAKKKFDSMSYEGQLDVAKKIQAGKNRATAAERMRVQARQKREAERRQADAPKLKSAIEEAERLAS